jgi:hypothetical protein
MWGIRDPKADALFRIVKNGKAGYINPAGKIVIPPTLPLGSTSGGEFHEGLLQVIGEHDEQKRYIDTSGKTVFRTTADSYAPGFSDGLAPAAIWRDVNGYKDRTFGFIDRTGRLAIPAQYMFAESFSEGLARVSVSGEVGSTGFIDTKGATVIPAKLSYGSDFHQGRAAVIISGPCKITNGGSCGRAIFKPTQNPASYDCKWAFIDKTGKPISDERFEAALDFSEGLAAVLIGNKWGFVDLSGKFVIRPTFDAIDPFSEGLATARQGGKTGFIDHSGNFEIPPQFDFAESFSNGRALVTRYGSNSQAVGSRFIGKDGKPAFPGEFALATSFHRGLAHVMLGDKKFAWIDPSGKRIFTYDDK